jgi:perosamine synthetase
MADKIAILKSEVSKYLNNSDNIFFYYKGRVALYAILKAMGVSKDDEVIIPAYTCVVVPNAIMYLGAKPIYVDIDRETYNMNINLIEKAINQKTKAIICQNTYGLSSFLENIIEIAQKHSLYTIEDCTHGFGGVYKGKPNGVHCDASFFSMQWNKPFSSGIGGFALINNPNLLDEIERLETEKIKPSLRKRLILRLLYVFNRYFLTNSTYWLLIKLYRFLSKKNLIVGSSSGEELEGKQMPSDYFMDYSDMQAAEAIRNIRNLKDLLLLRKKNAEIYSEFLKNNNKTYVSKELFENHSFLKYPLLVKNREHILNSAVKHKIKLGDWFISPLHPVVSCFENWHFYKDQYPESTDISEKIINLPADCRKPEKILSFLENEIDMII